MNEYEKNQRIWDLILQARDIIWHSDSVNINDRSKLIKEIMASRFWYVFSRSAGFYGAARCRNDTFVELDKWIITQDTYYDPFSFIHKRAIDDNPLYIGSNEFSLKGVYEFILDGQMSHLLFSFNGSINVSLSYGRQNPDTYLVVVELYDILKKYA